ncbi:unnamed protein product, partial [Oppiella nova]
MHTMNIPGVGVSGESDAQTSLQKDSTVIVSERVHNRLNTHIEIASHNLPVLSAIPIDTESITQPKTHLMRFLCCFCWASTRHILALNNSFLQFCQTSPQTVVSPDIGTGIVLCKGCPHNAFETYIPFDVIDVYERQSIRLSPGKALVGIPLIAKYSFIRNVYNETEWLETQLSFNGKSLIYQLLSLPDVSTAYANEGLRWAKQHYGLCFWMALVMRITCTLTWIIDYYDRHTQVNDDEVQYCGKGL